MKPPDCTQADLALVRIPEAFPFSLSHNAHFLLGRSKWLNLLNRKRAMLSLEECREHLPDCRLSDKQIEDVRDILYSFAEQALDYVNHGGIVVPGQEHDTISVWKTVTQTRTELP